jgi:hypothetical protein
VRTRPAALTAAVSLAILVATVGATPARAIAPAARRNVISGRSSGMASGRPGSGLVNSANDAALSADAHGAAYLTAERARSLAAARGLSGSITGDLTGPDGLPLAGACVSAIGISRSVTTGTSPVGGFDISGLAPGRYVLEYRDCAAPARYLTRWSGGGAWRRTAADVVVSADQVRQVPAMTLRPLNPSALRPDLAAWQRTLARSERALSAAAASTGTIAGVVTLDGRPLRGICVETSDGAAGAVTGKRGAYELPGLAPGRYYVVFEPFGICSDGNVLQQVYRKHNTLFGPPPGNLVTVAKGRTTRGIDGMLVRGGQISGTVTSQSGKRLRDICVETFASSPSESLGYQAVTGKHGTYILHALFPGKYPLEIDNCGNNGNFAPAFTRAVQIRGADHRTFNIRLRTGAVITGTVRLGSSTGPPLAGICVVADNITGSDFGSATTTASGRYTVTGLGTGVYQLTFTPGFGCSNDGNYVQVIAYARAADGKVTRGVNAVMQPGAVISGRVTNSSGHGLGGMCVILGGPAPANLPPSTSPDGSYTINQIGAGSYELGIVNGCGSNQNYAPYFYENQDDASLATPIPVATASRHTINPRMRIGAEITGTVTSARGRKLSGACALVATPSAVESGAVDADAYVRNGQYRLTGLEPGLYYVFFFVGPGCLVPVTGPYESQWFPDAASSVSARLVSLPAGRTTAVDAVLKPGGTITGEVTGTSGQPLAGICVDADLPVNGTSVVAEIGYPDTGPRGNYRMSGLPAGRFDVSFFPCAANFRYAQQWYRGRAGPASTTAVDVRAGATTAHIDARLTIGGTISGRVTGTDGRPLDNICPLAYNRSGQVAQGSTGRAGTYAMTGLASGRYTVAFQPCYGQNLVTLLRPARVVAPRATTGVDARLPEGGSVSGDITTAGPAATGVAFECAQVISANPDNAGSTGFSEPGGQYLATGLAPGTYTVYFGDPLCSDGPQDLLPQWFDGTSSAADATTVAVTARHTTAMIGAVLQATGEITGEVSTSSGVALSGACVTAYPAVPGPTPLVAVSRASGYSLIDVPPGRYRVEFSSGCGATGYGAQWWRNARTERAATVITVVADHVVTTVSARLSSR